MVMVKDTVEADTTNPLDEGVPPGKPDSSASSPNSTETNPSANSEEKYTADAWNNLRKTWIEYLKINKKNEAEEYAHQISQIENIIAKLLFDLNLISSEQCDSVGAKESSQKKPYFTNSGYDVRNILESKDNQWIIKKYDCEDCKNA